MAASILYRSASTRLHPRPSRPLRRGNLPPRKTAETVRFARIGTITESDAGLSCLWPTALVNRRPNKTTLFCMIIDLEFGYNAATLSGWHLYPRNKHREN